MKRLVSGSLTIAASALLLGGCLGKPMQPGQMTMNCVNTVLQTDAPLPDIVVMKNSDFSEQFGAQYNGTFTGRQLAAQDGKTVHTAENASGTVYLSSRRDPSVLPHELAHHARAHAGGAIDEAEAERAARLCAPQPRIAQHY
jgi:hypothetical protein